MSQQRIEPFYLGPEDTDTACLLIHGFSGTPAEMRGLGEALAAQGIRSYGMPIAGHGGTPEEFLHSNRRHWIASAEEGLAQLANYPRIFVAGLSMGGVLSLLLASRHPERINGVIAMSTPTRPVGGWQAMFLPFARYFVKWFYPLQNLNFNDPKVQAETLNQARLRDPNVIIDFSDPQTIAYIKRSVRIPVSSIDELMRLILEVRGLLGTVRSGLLIIQSKRDQLVSPVNADDLFRLTRIASPKSLHWLEQSDHVITIGPEREEVYSLATSFIRSMVAHDSAEIAQRQDVHQDGADESRSHH